MANAALMKKSNRLSILRAVREGDISRAELARRTGLTRAAVTMLVDELIGEGLLTEGVAVRSDKGRRPTMLSLGEGSPLAIGIDLSREGVSLTVCDLSMRVMREIAFARDLSREQMLTQIKCVVEELRRERRILGIGFAAPGPVDTEKMKILEPTGLEKWHGFEASSLREVMKLPIFLERDTRALAIAEAGLNPRRQSFISLLADHGLGGAFVYDGRIFGSREGFGCEIGHVSIDPSGDICSCGSRGCAELYASIPAIMRRSAKCGLGYSDFGELIKAAEENSTARALLLEMADRLSSALLCAVNLLEPYEIILSGKLAEAAHILKEPIEKRLKREAFTSAGRSVRVCASALGSSSRALAAAGVVIQKYFDGEII